MPWDPDQYLRYAAERAQPFHDLVAALEQLEGFRPRTVVDLGCGPGGLTASLLAHWPEARILGIDSSEEMIDRTRPRAVPDRLEFIQSDLREWSPDGPVDLVLSSSVLHWLSDHATLLRRLAGWLSPGGVLAVQVPANFDAPSHRLIPEAAAAVGLHAVVTPPLTASVEAPAFYLEHLTRLGLGTRVWETVYHHLLDGPEDVLEWLKGSTLRPVLAALDPDQAEELLHEYGARLADPYSQTDIGTVFPFRRLFVLARRTT